MDEQNAIAPQLNVPVIVALLTMFRNRAARSG